MVLLTTLVIISLFYPFFMSVPETKVTAKQWEYSFKETTSAASAEETTTETTTSKTTTKTKKKSKPKKTTTTTTTAKRPIIYLTDESEVYTNMSYSYMHTDYNCKNFRGTIVIMTFKQSCKLCIPYCEECASTVLYVPSESSQEEEQEEQIY